MFATLVSVDSTRAEVIITDRPDRHQILAAVADHRAGSQLVALLDKLLRQNKKKISHIKGLAVVAGPGSFAAVRSAVSTANAIGYARQIPVVALKLGEYKDYDELIAKAWKKLAKRSTFRPVLPIYDGEPNIGVKQGK